MKVAGIPIKWALAGALGIYVYAKYTTVNTQPGQIAQNILDDFVIIGALIVAAL